MATLHGPLVGLILFTGAFMLLGHLTAVPPGPIPASLPTTAPEVTHPAAPVGFPPAQVRPTPVSPMRTERDAIGAALASHANPHQIATGFYIDLIRSMEKAGLAPESARHVAVLIAGNPKLDTIAAMTIAGCAPAYAAATKRPLAEAVAELAGYIEQPERAAEAAPHGAQLVGPDTERRIREKLIGGNRVAAERLVQQALLARFNPALGAKILVPM